MSFSTCHKESKALIGLLAPILRGSLDNFAALRDNGPYSCVSISFSPFQRGAQRQARQSAALNEKCSEEEWRVRCAGVEGVHIPPGHLHWAQGPTRWVSEQWEEGGAEEMAL